MPDVPYPITAENSEDLKRQVWELIREIFEERIGGLNMGDIFEDSGGVLTLRLGSSNPCLQKVANALQLEVKAVGGLQATSTGVAAKLKTAGGIDVDSSGLYVSASHYGFGTIDCPAGSDPVADIPLDTLTLLATSGLSITGSSAADSVTFDNTDKGSTAVAPLIAVAVKTDTYNATMADATIVCNKTSAMTVNLPAATGSGHALHIKNINTGVVTVEADGTETVDGETNQTVNQWESISVVDYLSGKWCII